jgi:hypothetical protein
MVEVVTTGRGKSGLPETVLPDTLTSCRSSSALAVRLLAFRSGTSSGHPLSIHFRIASCRSVRGARTSTMRRVEQMATRHATSCSQCLPGPTGLLCR